MKTYLKHRITNLVDIKELMAIEYLDFAGKYAHYSESHNFWELCFVENGKLNVRIGTRHFTARKNQIFFVAPNSDHSYEAPPEKFLQSLRCVFRMPVAGAAGIGKIMS